MIGLSCCADYSNGQKRWCDILDLKFYPFTKRVTNSVGKKNNYTNIKTRCTFEKTRHKKLLFWSVSISHVFFLLALLLQFQQQTRTQCSAKVDENNFLVPVVT